MSLPAWNQRPFEEAALFNPAFVSFVLVNATKGFEAEKSRGLPFSLAFLIAPVVLASRIRDALPSRRDSSLAAWLQQHADIRFRFADLAKAMVPAVREGILYGLGKEALRLEGEELVAGKLRRGSATLINEGTKELRDIAAKATFVGRWYAHSGTVETIMVLWGVQP